MPAQYSLPLATSSALGGIQIGFATNAANRNYAVLLSGNKAYVNVPWTDTVYVHPTGGADTTIAAANGRVLSAITVNGLGHTTSVSYKTLAMTDMPSAMKYYHTVEMNTLGVLSFSGYNVTSQNFDFNRDVYWWEVMDKPASLAGYGIDKDDPVLRENYLTIEFFERLFQAYNGTARVNTNDATSTIDNIKAMFGFWTEQYLSALGLCEDGTTSSFDEQKMWQALGTSSSIKQISATYMANATRFNAVTASGNSITLSGVGVTETTLDLTHEHSWGEILDKPSTLVGYGISDTYIEGTTVYIGGAHIDVVPSGSVDLTGYAKESWVSQNYQPKGNYLTATDLSVYVPKSGATMNASAVLSRTGSSVSWYQGRLYPMIRTTSYTGYNAILSMKTTNGSWDLGVYSNNTAYLTYITDANYNAGTNAATYQLTFPKATGTLALTSQIPTTLPASDVYAWAKAATKPTYEWSEITGKPNVAIQQEHNNLTASGNEFTTAAGGQTGAYYWNYRTSGGTNGAITEYRFCNGNGSGTLADLVGAHVKASGSLYSTKNGNTVSIGSDNSSWCHIYNSADIPFIFNKGVYTMGSFMPYSTNNDLGSSSAYFRGAYVNYINVGSNRYYSDYGINMNNSDLIGCNSIRTQDLSDDYTEGLLFARTNGNWDSFRAADGNFYFHYNNGTNMMQMNTDGIYLYSGWLRTYNSTGWFNQTYGGGWYMQDSSWIRSYGGKYVYVDSYFQGAHVWAGSGSGVDSSYALHVNGVGYFTSGVYSAGYVTALSDARKKDVMGSVRLSVEDVAYAPAVKFMWKQNHAAGMQVGTIAQYWSDVLPEVVQNHDGELSMSYGVTALMASIATAKRVVDHERRISELERENELLKEQISQLKAV